MAILTFTGSDVLPLLEHAKHAKGHSAGRPTKNPGPGLLLVKDSGVFLMSNGFPRLESEHGATESKVVYAHGLEPASTKDEEHWNEQYDKIQEVSADDFVELIAAREFCSLRPDDQLRIELTGGKMKISFIRLQQKGKNEAATPSS